MARIDNLNNYLTDIATAIKDKKGDNSPIKASNFDTEITNLPSGGGSIDEYFDITPKGQIGQRFQKIIKKLPTIDTSNCTDLSQAFANFEIIEEFSFEINCINNTNCYNLFAQDYKLKKCPIVTNTGKVTNYNDMFIRCNELLEIKLDLDLTSARNISQIIERCNKLKKADLTLRNIPENLGINYLCFYCDNLEILILRSDTLLPMTGTQNLTSSKLTSIYVPDNLIEEYKVATNWSAYANKFKPLSEYVEE